MIRKRLLSACLALALCLGLLPATALAADGIELYVGGQRITESGCYEKNQDGNWTKVGCAEPASGQFSYDAATATLTLNQAKIVNYQDVTVGGGFTYPGSVIAFSQSADVSLTIVVSQGTSNITGTGGIRVVSKAGDASLSISGPGSLEVKNVSNDSGIVLIGSKNVNLGINSADVTISNVQYYGVQLAAGDACKSTATINDGNLTASGSAVGIYFMRLYNDGPSSLTVSGNAMVDTEGSTGGIINGSPDSFQIGADGESGGIVFNGNSGTVYGNVTLEDDLEIASGETLTIGKDASLTVPDGKTLTNNGTVTTEEGGTLTGNITNAPPKINTEGLSEGTVNTKYNQTLAADNNPTSWSVTSGSLPTGLTLNGSTGVISGTPTAAGTYSFTVTATNGGGSDSRAFSLTISPATNIPVQSVSLDKTSLGLTEGKTAQLNATVVPDNATNKAVTWTSSNPSVARVENGVVTAVSAGTATITAAAADGSGKSATCAVTVEKPYTPPPYIPPSKPNWTSVARKLANAQPGDTVTVKMNGETEVPGEVWETIAGRDVTVILDMGGNVSWRVDGNDVPTATHFADMDFGVDRNTTGIDVDVINAITGEVSSVQITLAHDGEFGFALTLTAPLGRENAGYWANLYHYDENAKTLNYETSAQVASDGTASLRMTHASQYAIIIDDQTHQLPFEDVTSGTWYEGAVRYAYLHDIMEGMSATTFQPNGTLSRAMAVQIFYNLEGQPDISDENLGYPYEDVNAQAWYGDAVYWARITGVATGYGDGTFQPTDSITRQEFAQMLYNYAKYKGYDLTAEGDLSQFPDSGSVADWAEAAMSWANGNELINGHDDGTIDAAGTGTRAQAASILMRFDQNLVEK